MSKTAKVFLIVGGIIAAFVLVAVIGLAIVAESLGKPDVPENSVLVLDVSGSLPDYSADDPLARAFGMGSAAIFFDAENAASQGKG